jgi:IS5 family transposase
MFRMLVLQALNNLSDEQAEYQVRDRLSFTRILRLGIEDSIRDATTLWLFREKLAKAGLIEKGRTHDRHRASARQNWLAELAYNIRRLVTLERIAAAA